MAAVHANHPIPSIESPLDNRPATFGRHFSVDSDGTRPSTPSSDILTPTHTSPASSTRSTPARAGSATSTIAHELANTRLSPPTGTFDMSHLSRASELAAKVSSRGRSSSSNIYDATPRLSFSPAAQNASVSSNMARTSSSTPRSPLPDTFDMSHLSQAVQLVAEGPRRGSPSSSNIYEATPRSLSPAVHHPSLSSHLDRSPSATPQPAAGTERQTHDVADEEPPADAVHSIRFQQALKDSKALMADLRDVLGSSTLHTDGSSTIHKLHKQATELADFQYPSTRTVGLVGDSGVGKSSLINSLLDFRDIARASGSGQACTCVVTEYRYHEHSYMNIRVDLFSEEELKDQIQALLQSYRHFYLHEHELEGEDRRDAEEKAKLALDTFRAMFRNRMQGEDLISETFEIVFERLERWVADLRPERRATEWSGLCREECSMRLMELSSETQDQTHAAPWPFIKAVRVYLNAHILSSGLVLADLPGLRDLNSARQNITERYLLECNEVLAVCTIGRAITDVGVQHVFQLAQRAGKRNVGVVCTRSEDVNAEELAKHYGGQRAAEIRSMSHATETDKRDVEWASTQLSGYQTDDETNEEEEIRLSRQLRNAQRRLARHTLELTTFLMRCRNGDVTEQLRQRYKDQVPGNEIKVFPVSNLMYWENRDRPPRNSLPYLNLSGIIAARRHCLSIVASSQHRAVRHYIENQVPGCLAQIDHWVQSGSRSGSVERRETVLRALEQVEARLTRSLTSRTSVARRLASIADQDFKELVYDKKNVASWTQSSKSAALEWTGWAHATYSAFCRNHGNYMTPAVGRRDWNSEAMTTMIQDLQLPWEELMAASKNRHESLLQVVGSATQLAIESLETACEDNSHAPRSLVDIIDTQGSLLINEIEEAREKLETDFENIRIDALTSIGTSLMGKALKPSYQACQYESGRGSDSRRKAIMTGRLGDEVLFSTLMKDFRDMFKASTAEHQASVSNDVSNYLENIKQNLELVRSDNAVRESERDPDFRSRVVEAILVGWETSRRTQDAVGS